MCQNVSMNILFTEVKLSGRLAFLDVVSNGLFTKSNIIIITY